MHQNERVGLGALFLFASTAAFAQQAPSGAGTDWEGFNKSLDGQRYSLLNQINVSNAAALTEVCRVPVAARGSMQAGPVVVGDSMFVTTPTDTFAIDPLTCRIKWQHTYHRSQEPGLSVNRGAAYLNGRVFRGTDDGRLIALDAATGREAWVDVVGDASLGEYIAAAPVGWNGLVIVGNSVVVLDARTGELHWWYQLHDCRETLRIHQGADRRDAENLPGATHEG